jgi:hypothetical protein
MKSEQRKKAYAFAVCYLFFGSLLHAPALPAQTAAEIDALLSSGALSYGEAASFVLKAADAVSEIQVFGTAFEYALEQKWLPANAESGGRAALDGVSLLIMRAFGIKGGIMYSLTKKPHFAYRELVYQGIIQGRSDPDMAVSGDLLLFMIGKTLDRVEGEL